MPEEFQSILAAALRGELTESQVHHLYALGVEAVTAAMMAAARHLATQQARLATQQAQIAELRCQLQAIRPPEPSTPSGQRPIYTKPPAPKRHRPPGARLGHPGSHRSRPKRIDRRVEHRLPVCPHCGGELQRCQRTRRRIIEDIPAELASEVVEHTLHRDYCPQCRKHVEPVVPDALPKATFGHRLMSLTSWLHYGLGVTMDQIVSIVGYHLHTPLTAGGLVAAWQRAGSIFEEWYEQIGQQARASAVLHADETGWRVNGRTHWLWCFASQDACYYQIDRSRGGPALAKFFLEALDGVLVHDFWAAYDAIEAGDHQCCLAHLLRELEKVDLTNDSSQWRGFAKRLRRLVRDGIRLRKRADFHPQRYGGLIRRIDRRLMELAEGSYGDADAQRLAKRLGRYCDSLFTFLDHPEVPYENNHAERMIRPAVIIRKNSQSNRSDKGALTQAVLMSVYRTLKLRGHNPMDTIASALRTYLTTGHLPPLPVQFVADG